MSVTLAQLTGPAYTRIYSYGAARGENAVPNEDLIGPIDSSDEWIQQRTGIAERRWVGEGENVETMALSAARTAIERSGVPAAEIGAVIVATVTYFHQTPSLAAKLAHQLGTNGAAYD